MISVVGAMGESTVGGASLVGVPTTSAVFIPPLEFFASRVAAAVGQRPTTITAPDAWNDVTARDSKVADFSHGFARIGIDNQAPLLFEVDQRHLLSLVKEFNDVLLDGEQLVRRSRTNPLGRISSASIRLGPGGKKEESSTLEEALIAGHGGANFMMKVSDNLIRADMQRRNREEMDDDQLLTPTTPGAGGGGQRGRGVARGSISPLRDRYDSETEVMKQLCGVPPTASTSMRFRLTPWRSLFGLWITGMLEERRPEPRGGVPISVQQQQQHKHNSNFTT